MNATALIGMGVLDKDAINVGKITDLEFNPATWLVTGVIIKTGFLKKLMIDVGKIDKIGDRVILNVTLDQIKK